MLYLIGFGISNFKGISLRGLEIARKSDKVYIETYTSSVKINLREVEEIIGKKVELLSRRDLENGRKILDESKDKTVVLLTPGDPLIATTHISLIIEAKRIGVKTKVVHAASIYSAAISESGLQVYRFGKVATLAKLGRVLPFSVYDTIADNKSRGLHTLLLLQQDIESKQFISVIEAVEALLKMERMKKMGVVSEDDVLIVLSNIEADNMVKIAGTIRELREVLNRVAEFPSVIIVPGKLHFMEEEALRLIWVKESGE